MSRPAAAPPWAAVHALLDLAVGRRCLGCGWAGASWCDRCVATELDIHRRTAPSGLEVIAGARYQGQLQRAAVAHKEHGQLSLVRPLARLLVAAMGRPAGATVVAVPSRASAVRARGQDHAQRLAERAAVICGGSATRALRWVRAADDQAGLGVAGRRRNVDRAMVARGGPGASAVWLVDDIMTSGATLDEAARALVSAGWTLSGVAVIASVDARMDQPRTSGRSALADRGTLR